MGTKQDVIFQGLTHSPSDYNCQDGELATCLNLINEDGALHPIHQPVVVDENIYIPDGTTIEMVHKVNYDNSIHTHYIIHGNSWYWKEKGGNGEAHSITGLSDFQVNAVTAVGNILCFVGDSKTIYAYWKDGQYVLMDFSTIKYAGISVRENGNKTYDVIETNDAVSDIDDHAKDKGNHYVKFKDNIDGNAAHKLFLAKDAYLNKKMDDESFKYVQFGVLALKLYDGSHILVGNPFTITNGEGVDNNINLWYVYKAHPIQIEGLGEKFYPSDNTYYAVHLKQSLFKYKLKIDFSDITKYEDIIDGVDVYVSNSIYPYKTNVELSEEQKKAYDNNTDQYLQIETEDYGMLILRNAFTFDAKECLGHWSYPALSKDEFNEKVSNLTFYKSVSFTYNDVIKKKEKYLKRVLETEESLSLASSFRDSFGAKCAITYNNRLHLANVSTTNRSTVNGYVSNQLGYARVITHVKYKYNGNTLESYGVDSLQFPLDPVLAFPSDNVISYEVYVNYGGSYYHKEVEIYDKNQLGLSFYTEYDSGKLQYINSDKFESISSSTWNQVLATATSFHPANIYSPSLVKVSEAENPLVFPAKNSVQVGSSVVNALAANTRPISEGQFGDAPLYAFTDEGVWVLMLGSEGTYQARQPAQRDICSNPKGILQIDDAVLFPTERGIMMQQGREAVCITDVLDDYPFDFLQIYSHSTKDKTYPNRLLALGNIPESDVQYVRFRTYLQSSDMIYDYYDSRIIVFNPSYTYAYVYSLKSKLWGTMHNVFSKRVNIYPESYAINDNGRIVDVYVKEPTEDVRYFLCSRPLSLGQEDVHKTMLDCIARGNMFSIENGKYGMVLFGSNDLNNWYFISSSVNRYLRNLVGSPFKYFRIVMMGSLGVNECISRLSTDFQTRWQNKIR